MSVCSGSFQLIGSFYREKKRKVKERKETKAIIVTRHSIVCCVLFSQSVDVSYQATFRQEDSTNPESTTFKLLIFVHVCLPVLLQKQVTHNHKTIRTQTVSNSTFVSYDRLLELD